MYYHVTPAFLHILTLATISFFLSMHDILMSSMCQHTVSCFPPTILLSTHGSYVFILNPYASRSPTNFSKNRSVLFRQPYRSFCRWTYRTACSVSYDTNGRYSALSVATISSAYIPLNTMCTPLSISALKYAPGVSTTATSCPSSASIVAASMTASVETVGYVASFGSIFSYFFLLSATPRPFIDPSRFSFRNISRASDSCFCFTERFSVLTGQNSSLL